MSPNSITLNLDYFETIILYKILSDNHYANLVINNLEPQYFNSKDKKIIFDLIKKYYLTNDKLPNISELKQYLSTNELQQSFINVINEIKNTDKQINEQELIKNTEHFIKERGIFNIIWNVAKQENIEPYIILEKIQNICNVSLDTDAGLDLYNDVDDIINKLTTPNSYIKTGWKWLDNCIDGGWLKDGNALYVFYGRPNIGKSIILGNMADNIAKQGYNVMIITLEMNEYLYAKRLLSRITHIPIKHLTSDVDVLKNAIEQNKKGNIFIKEFPTGAVNPQYIGSYIEQLKKKGIKIDAVVLDYIDLLVWPGNIEEHLKKKKIAENLRGWSTKLKIPIISADQLNRCLTLDTKIQTDKGECEIKDLKIGDKILSNNGFNEVKYIYPIETKPVYKITLKSGKTIKCSDTHLFPTDNGILSIKQGLKKGMKLNSI